MSEYLSYHERLRLRAAEEAKAEGIAVGKAEGIAEGKAEGIAEGKAEGIAEGIAVGETKVIDGMLSLGLDLDVIAKASGQTLTYIKSRKEAIATA